MGNHNLTATKHWGPRVLVIVAVLLVIVAGIMAKTVGTSSAETPAERCKRETAQYNAAWASAWSTAHPGSKPSDAPPPPVPYRCGQNDNQPPPTIAPTSSSEAPTSSAAPSSSPADPTGESGPNLNPPTNIEKPASGVIPGQPSIGSPNGTHKTSSERQEKQSQDPTFRIVSKILSIGLARPDQSGQ